MSWFSDNDPATTESNPAGAAPLTRAQYDSMSQAQRDAYFGRGGANAAPAPAPATTDPRVQWARDQITRLYQQYKHRPPTAQELAQWETRGPDGINQLTNQFSHETAAPASASQASGASTAGMDQRWLDWIDKTYGTSKSRGRGFADLPTGVSLEQVIQRFNKETGSQAKYIGGPSGDRVDFGQGVTDALTGGGQLWSDYGAMGGSARPGANVPTSGGSGGSGGGSGSGGGGTGGGGGGATLANISGGPAVADFTVKPWEQKFVAPTQGEAAADPGFQFTLARGKEALERSAAARGTLLTTGTLKDLDQYSQGMGSQQYDKVYGRRMGEYKSDYDDFTGNESRRFAAHQTNFGNNLALNQNAFGQGMARDQFGLSVNQNQFSQGLATNQNAFNQQFSLANLGYGAATQAGQAGSNYADAAGNIYGQQGNANAAAGMYGAQSGQNVASSLGNLGGYYAGLYANRHRPTLQDPTRDWTRGYY